MKKILVSLITITLIGISTASLVACNNVAEYTPEELAKLKEENQIDTTNETVKKNLEWIAPQEKPFNQVDDKWYFVVWRVNKNDDWKIIKFLNDTFLSDEQTKEIDLKNNYELFLYKAPYFPIDLVIGKINNIVSIVQWREYIKNKTYFKSIYRWNLEENNLPYLVIDNKGNIKVKDE